MEEARASSIGRQDVDRATPFLCYVAIAGVALYLVLDIVAQALPPHYSPIRQAESDLAVGPYGWVMTVNFVVRGLLSFALLAALVRVVAPKGRARVGMWLFGFWAGGALLLAIFPTDISGGEHSAHGKIHLLVAFVAFVCVAIGERMIARGFPTDVAWARLRQIATTLSYVTWFGLVLLVLSARTPRVSGLTERIFLGAALLWILVVAWQLPSVVAGSPADVATIGSG